MIFHHSCFPTVTAFWSTHGKWWTGDVDRFASASALKQVADGLVASGDTEQQKADKLYAAVASLRNLSFGTSATAEADERAEMKIGNARDVWERKQGSAQDLTLLFVGLARAAGLKAYVIAVADRSQNIFDPKAVREEDINDYVAIVSIDGKEQFFDPGEPFCPPGQLSWKHSVSGGLRQSDSGPTFGQTPGGIFKQNQTLRTARLQLAKDGAVSGTVSLTISGASAIDWRQSALRNPDGFNQAIAADVAASLPAGLSVKTTQVSGLTEPVVSASAPPLVVKMELSGTIPLTSAGEIAVPASLFEARSPELFAAGKRDTPIDMRYPSVSQDVVTLMLPAGATVKSTLSDATIPFGDSARLVIKHTPEANRYTVVRMLIQGKTFYATSEYPDLKAFYAKLNTQDAEKIVIAPAP